MDDKAAQRGYTEGREPARRQPDERLVVYTPAGDPERAAQTWREVRAILNGVRARRLARLSQHAGPQAQGGSPARERS